MNSKTCQQLVNDCAANTPTEFFKDLTQTMDLWMREFGSYEDGLVETAVKMHLNGAKTFPTVAEIKTNIRELKRDLTPRYDPPRSTAMPEAVKRVWEMARTGELSKAVADMDITQEISFARKRFPNITDELVRKNFCEISYARQQEKTCKSCLILPVDCDTYGFVPELSMNPDGNISQSYVPCHKKIPNYGKIEKKAG